MSDSTTSSKPRKTIRTVGSLVVVASTLTLGVLAPTRWSRSLQAVIEPPVAWTKNHTSPKLSFRHAPACDVRTLSVEACVIRNGVSEEALAQFLEQTAGQEVSIGKAPPGVGSFSSAGWAGVAPGTIVDTNKAIASIRTTTVAQLQRGAGPKHSYSGFRSFNYSDYAPLLEPLVDRVFGGQSGRPFPDRADLFLGDMAEDVSTAAIHANQFEISTTVQVFGEKIWSFVDPECMWTEFEAYHIGGGIFPSRFGADAWGRCEITTLHARPGDVIAFPKAWPHQIYTLAGPNMMINFRSDGFDATNPDDWFAIAHHLIAPKLSSAKKLTPLCAAGVEQKPTAYGHGMPTPSTWFSKFKQSFAFNRKEDLRHCNGGNLNMMIKNHNWVAAQNAPGAEVGRQYLREARSFHNI